MTDLSYALCPHVRLEQEDGGDTLVVIDSRTGAICATNSAASIILHNLQKGASAAELAGLLAARFGIAADHAQEDARAFLDHLNAVGFVQIA